MTARWIILVVAAAACERDHRTELEKRVDRAYAVYHAVADAVEDAPDCETAARAAMRVLDRQADALADGFAFEHDPALMARARPVLEARADEYRALAGHLDAALARCADTPAFAEIESRLDPAEP